jgi:hypothetical protein
MRIAPSGDAVARLNRLQEGRFGLAADLPLTC